MVVMTNEKRNRSNRELKFFNYLEGMFDDFDVSHEHILGMEIKDDLGKRVIYLDTIHNVFTIYNPKYEKVVTKLANIYEKYLDIRKGLGEVKVEFDYSGL